MSYSYQYASYYIILQLLHCVTVDLQLLGSLWSLNSSAAAASAIFLDAASLMVGQHAQLSAFQAALSCVRFCSSCHVSQLPQCDVKTCPVPLEASELSPAASFSRSGADRVRVTDWSVMPESR